MSKKLSLQEQLLKSGLVSSAKAKTVKTEKYKQAQLQRKNNVQVTDETKELARKTREAQLAKDHALNQQRQQQAQQKELIEQIKQLIEANKLVRDENGEPYRFIHKDKVKTIYVADAMRQQLMNGKLAIVKCGKTFEVVSAEAAQKIRERDASFVCLHHETIATVATPVEDEYAAYQVPDDLMW